MRQASTRAIGKRHLLLLLLLLLGMNLGTLLLNLGATSQSSASGMESIHINGRDRTFLIRVPRSGLQPGMPAVVVLHGSKSSGVFQREAARQEWSQVADREGILLVFPNATTTPGTFDVGWDRRPGSPPETQVPNVDVPFLTRLVQELPVRYGVDPRRIYMCGVSSGAAMAARMAGEISERLAAVGMVSGSIAGVGPHGLVAPPTPKHPIPAIHVHGRLDVSMPYEGGGLRKVYSMKECAQFWRTSNRIQAESSTTAGEGWIRQAWKGEGARQEVVLITLTDFVHGWPAPGSTFAASPVSATDELWSFFSHHQLPTPPPAADAWPWPQLSLLW